MGRGAREIFRKFFLAPDTTFSDKVSLVTLKCFLKQSIAPRIDGNSAGARKLRCYKIDTSFANLKEKYEENLRPPQKNMLKRKKLFRSSRKI